MRRGLLVPFALVIALAGCSRPGSGRIDPALASLVPPDTIALASIDMEQLRGTPAYQALVSESRIAGIDGRALYQVVTVSDGRRTSALARGKFAPADGSEPRIDLPNAARSAYKGYTLVSSGDQTLTFMNPSVIVGGTQDSVRWIIDQRSKSAGIPPALARRLESIPPENQMWMVAAGAAPILPSPNAANIGRVLSMTDTVVAGADLRNGARGFATLECRNDRNASDLAEGLKALLSLARLSAPADKPEIGRALGGVQINQNRRVVDVKFALSQSDFEALLAFSAPSASRR